MAKIRKINSGTNHLLSYLSEKTRKDLVTKSLKQSPERVARSTQYRITGKVQIEVEDFIYKDELKIKFPINQYTCTIEMTGLMDKIIYIVDRQYRGNVNFDAVEKAISAVIDNEEYLKVDCTCPDFYYRFSFVATKNKYKSGKRQQIPAPITNPHDNIGSMCKHLICILKNKKAWLRKLTSVINYLIKEYYYDILQIYDLDPYSFFINISGKHNPKKGAIPTDKRSKRDHSEYTNADTDEDSEEELRLRIPNST